MNDKAAIKLRFQELVQNNSRTIRIIRSPSEVDSLDLSKATLDGYRSFDNYDESMLVFISKALSDGKEIAIQAAGPQKIMVTAARNLFRKRY